MFQSSSCSAVSRGLAALAFLAAASFAHGQAPSPTHAHGHGHGTAARAERADPLDAQARVPAATHSSALATYRRLGDDARTDWRQANETVNRIGGWKAYARQAQQPEPAAPAPAGRGAPAPAHGGHKSH